MRNKTKNFELIQENSKEDPEQLERMRKNPGEDERIRPICEKSRESPERYERI